MPQLLCRGSLVIMTLILFQGGTGAYDYHTSTEIQAQVLKDLWRAKLLAHLENSLQHHRTMAETYNTKRDPILELPDGGKPAPPSEPQPELTPVQGRSVKEQADYVAELTNLAPKKKFTTRPAYNTDSAIEGYEYQNW